MKPLYKVILQEVTIWPDGSRQRVQIGPVEWVRAASVRQAESLVRRRRRAARRGCDVRSDGSERWLDAVVAEAGE